MVQIHECPNCGASIEPGAKKCPYCKSPILITNVFDSNNLSFIQLQKYQNKYKELLAQSSDDIDLNISLGMIFMKLKLYDKANVCFSKAIDKCFDNPDLFYSAAICKLEGRKAFLTPRENINQAMNFLKIAAEIEPKGIYYYFMAYITKDYFERKFFKTERSSNDLINLAALHGCTVGDADILFDLLGVANPL